MSGVRTVRDGGRNRVITTKTCTICGCSATFLDLTTRDVVDHRCPSSLVGPVWVLIGPVPA